MIKTAHVIASSRGGGATYCKDLAVGLQGQGHPQSVVMPCDGGHVTAQQFEEKGVSFNLWENTATVRACASEHDILLCHGARAAFWARMACMGMRDKRPTIVYAIHGFMIPHYPFHRRHLLTLQERLMRNQTDHCLAVCEAEKRAWCNFGLAKQERVHVLYYGLEPNSFEKTTGQRETLRTSLNVQKKDLVITQVSRFFRPRDFPVLLAAFDRVANTLSHAKLLLVGDGPWHEQIIQQIQTLHHGDRVIVTGQRHDTTALYHASDIAVLSSAGGDGLPIANLEAMACGLPVISANCDGIPEQIVDGKTGLLYQVGDVDSLTRHLHRLATDDRLRSTMGEAGRQRVESVFSRQQMVNQAATIFEGL